MLQLNELTARQLKEHELAEMTTAIMKQERVAFNDRLRSLGAVWYDLRLPETKLLPHIVHADEVVTGLVFGRYRQPSEGYEGRGALVCTNKRLLLLDKKPLFVRCDEISFMVISGVNYSRAGLTATVTLHTRVGDIILRTFNMNCAKQFIEAIEARIFELKQQRAINF